MNSYVNDFNTAVRTYYKELKKFSPLTREEEKTLLQQAKNNDLKARNKILTSNLKFVFDVAKTYKGCGVSIDDLIAEGNVGLTKAISKFNPDYDVKFISYGVFWIRQSMQSLIKQQQKRKAMEISSDDELIKPITNGKKIFDEEDEKLQIIDVMSSNEEEEEKKEKEKNQRELISKLLTILDDREKIIISEYFGLNGKTKTLEEIGSILDLSKERVRQIKEKSLKKLRSEMLILSDS